MQAFEFHATTKNGYIKIPKKYEKIVGSKVRVILFSTNQSNNIEHKNKKSLRSVIGIMKACGDVDLKQSRVERMQKYENIN